MSFVAFFIPLLFQLLLFTQNAQLQPTFSSQPSNPSTVEEGGDLILQWNLNLDGQSNLVSRILNVTAGALQNVATRQNGDNATVEAGYENLFRATITDTQATLTILAVPKSINGEIYQLRILTAAPHFFTLQSDDVKISVLFPPGFNGFSPDRVVVENDPATITLSCSADGNPTPTVNWTRVFDGSDSDVLFTGNSYVINNNRSNAGTYRCKADNGVGSAINQTIRVTVNFKPENVQLTLSDSSICQGDVFNISCSADGNPPVHTYLLFENDTLLNTSGSSLVTRTASAGGVLVYRCEANNTVGTANATTTVTVNEASVIQALINITVIEGENSSLTCRVTGTPMPSVSWTEVRTGGRTEGSIRSLINVSRSDAGEYKCEASNFCGNDSKSTFVIVNFKPEDVQLTTNVTSNKVCLNDVVFFNCSTANANPAVALYQFFENDVLFGSSSSGMFSKMVMNSGNLTYKCVANNTAGTTSSQDVSITVNVPASIQSIEDQFVIERRNTSVICNASGTPQSTVFWIDVAIGQRTNSSVLEFINISRSEAGEYRCEASNECGSAVEAVNVTVQYSPVITEPQDDRKQVEKGGVCECKADGNPPPEYSWKGATGAVLTPSNTLIVTDDGNYTCVAENRIGSDAHRIFIEIKKSVHGVDLTVQQQYQKYYNDLNDTRTRNFTKPLENGINATYKDDPKFDDGKVVRLGNGSVIASVFLYFKTPVTVNQGLAELRSAVRNGTIGPYTVTDLKVIEVFEVVNPTFTPVVSNTASTNAPVTRRKNTTSSSKDGPPWAIIGAVIGGVVVLIVITVVVAWWVHKKRKCRRKGTKIHNSESEVLQGQNDMEDGAYARVNGGYADAGPPSANGTNKFVQQPQPQPEQQQQQEAAAPPAYAVVDKSKKKKKKAEAEEPYAEVEDPKKDKKTADPSTHDYAVVNKSKKKKKEADENAYATVDKSKKSKKGQQKPKAPGEVLYADLDDFKPVQAPSMPTISTSPEPLAPLKRPTSYQATEYADITQFLKGNATLPEGQSTEMQPTYANAGGGQGAAANKENANTGGEGGGGDTEPKETPM